MSDKHISHKSFFEEIDRKLKTSSKEDLRDILLAMAKEITPEERASFLKTLQPAKKEELDSLLRLDELLADIDDFALSYTGRMKRADDMDEYPEDYNDDDDSLGIYAEFVSPLEILFDRAKDVFEAGNYALAVKAYEKN